MQLQPIPGMVVKDKVSNFYIVGEVRGAMLDLVPQTNDFTYKRKTLHINELSLPAPVLWAECERDGVVLSLRPPLCCFGSTPTGYNTNQISKSRTVQDVLHAEFERHHSAPRFCMIAFVDNLFRQNRTQYVFPRIYTAVPGDHALTPWIDRPEEVFWLKKCATLSDKVAEAEPPMVPPVC